MEADFTPLQKEAITWRQQDVCVVAGPGSGKTTVLVERFFQLVEGHNFDLRHILAITFTEKAAANMKAKIAAAFAHNPAKQAEVDNAWISTIHGFCTRLLKENAVAAGIDPAFAVLDQYEAEDLQRECMSGALDQTLELRPAETMAMMEALAQPDIAWHLLNTWDAIRSAGMEIVDVRNRPRPWPLVTARELAGELRQAIAGWVPASPVQREELGELRVWAQRMEREGTAESVLSHKANLRRVAAAHKKAIEELREVRVAAFREGLRDERTAPHRQLIFDIFQRFIETYAQRKAAIARLDFADLERNAISLLRNHPPVRERLRTRFRQIMLDEYQDINEQQQQLVDLIRGEDVFFGVGDVNQSIYGFRHAKPDIFRAYRSQIEEAGKQLAPLEDNFRSRPQILRCVEDVLRGAPGIEPRELEARGKFEIKSRPSVEIIQVMDEDREEGAEREAGWIAHRILGLRHELNLEFRDFGVLCRTRDGMDPVLRALDARRIPYVCGRRQSYLVSREGRDLAALVAVLANARDEISLTTVLRSPLAGVKDETLLALRLAANSLAGGLNAALHDETKMAGIAPDEAVKLRAFAARLARWRSETGALPLDRILSRAVPEPTPDAESFLSLARSKGAEMTPVQFLRLVEQLRDARATSEIELADEEQGNCVQVMTTHAAKGLEFGVAMVVAMNKGSRTETEPVNFTREHGLGLKWAESGEKKGAKDSWCRANSERIKEREKEEENRLLYVAMTRAKEHLVMSWSAGHKPEAWAKKVNDLYRVAEGGPGQRLLVRDSYEVAVLVTAESAPTEPASEAADVMRHPVEDLAPPARGDQSDSTVTVTSLALFAHDPEKYHRERYLGWSGALRRRRFDPEALPADKDSASDTGSAVHEALAGKPGTFSDEAEALAETFRRSALGIRAAASPHAEREWEFIQDVDGTLVRGSIDLWFEEEGQLIVVDYKTDDVTAAEVAARARHYDFQLALYALALGRKVRTGYLHFLRPDVVVEIPLDQAVLDAARQLVRRLRDTQNITMEF